MSSSNDFHQKPFTPETLTKLTIFNDYIKEWLPVFIKRNPPIWKRINIFDFFAGPGVDSMDTEGSPLLIVKEVKTYLKDISGKGLNVGLYFNEFDRDKCKHLKMMLGMSKYDCHPCHIEILNEKFEDAFNKYYQILNDPDTANLVFLDQYGFKYVNTEVFRQLVNCSTTDFLFFITSSTIYRFIEDPVVQQYIKMKKEKLPTSYFEIHRIILEYYKSHIERDSEFYLAPFSIKKGSNIYGIIFGSGSLLGMEKFLITSWKNDSLTGEANFDIDGDNIDINQYELFERKPKKIEVFERELTLQIKDSTLKNNRDVYIFTITSGFLPKHANKVVKQLIESGILIKKYYCIDYKHFKSNELVSLELK